MRRAALLAGAALLAAPAAAQERLVVKPPPDWVQVIRDYTPALRTVGFVPKGQTAADWREMITFQVALGRADVSPKDAAAEIRQRWRKICRDLSGDEPKLYWEKDYLAVQFFLQCLDPRRDLAPADAALKKVEVLAVKAIQGRDSFFLVERAWHADAPAADNPFASPAVRKAWLDFFATAEVCDGRIPKQPCRADPAAAPADATAQQAPAPRKR